MPAPTRPTGLFYLFLMAATGIASATYIMVKEGITPAELIAGPPGLSSKEAGDLLAAGFEKPADNYVATADDPTSDSARLKSVCEAMSKSINGLLEKAGAESRFKFSYTPALADPPGVCNVSFNGASYLNYTDPDQLDETDEVRQLRDYLINKLTDDDLRKLSAADPSLFKPVP